MDIDLINSDIEWLDRVHRKCVGSPEDTKEHLDKLIEIQIGL